MDIELSKRTNQGHFWLISLLEAGIKPGPISKNKRGESVTLENGRVINPEDFLGPDQEGRIVTILGDTRYCDNAI